MRKLHKVIMLGSLALLASVLTASAVQIRADVGPYNVGVGGEFSWAVVGGSLDLSGYAAVTSGVYQDGVPWFQSFCLEGEEYFKKGNTYNAVINQNAIHGGVGPAGDPVSVGTGWLYQQFATASWVTGLSYNYGANRKDSAGALQKTIWWLEGEMGIAYDAGNIYMSAVVNQFGSEAAAKADGGWNYGVYALNLTTPTGARVQDQLYYRPISVPEGGVTAMLLALGLGGMACVSRRLRK